MQKLRFRKDQPVRGAKMLNKALQNHKIKGDDPRALREKIFHAALNDSDDPGMFVDDLFERIKPSREVNHLRRGVLFKVHRWLALQNVENKNVNIGFFFHRMMAILYKPILMQGWVQNIAN